MIKSFLFLQGPHGPFFRTLGRALRKCGHEVVRINFNGGDFIDWPWPDSMAFRDRLLTWPSWIAALARRREVTDLVLYGDCRPLHRAAIAALEPDSVRIHVFEEGYLRPDWITLERNGVNGNSRMRLNAEELIKEMMMPRMEPGHLSLHGIAHCRIKYCLRNYIGRTLGLWLFPNYRTHRPCSAWHEAVS